MDGMVETVDADLIVRRYSLASCKNIQWLDVLVRAQLYGFVDFRLALLNTLNGILTKYDG
jgi:hypothetical protein